MRRMNNIGLNHQILVDEICRIGIVCMNTPHLGGSQIHLINLVRLKEILDCSLISYIHFLTSSREDISIPEPFQAAHNCRPDHTPMASYENNLIKIMTHS